MIGASTYRLLFSLAVAGLAVFELATLQATAATPASSARSDSAFIEPSLADTAGNVLLERSEQLREDLLWTGAPRSSSATASVFERQGFALPEELLRRDARSFRNAFYISLLAMIACAILLALRQLFCDGLNRGMERLVIWVHGGERSSHRRRRRPSDSSKYATLSHYLNEGQAGRRRRRRSTRTASRSRSEHHSSVNRDSAWRSRYEQPRSWARDQVVGEVILTNGCVPQSQFLGCAS